MLQLTSVYIVSYLECVVIVYVDLDHILALVNLVVIGHTVFVVVYV